MEERKTVCVTGGTGFIASWLIMRLLQHGYSVQATIRSNPGGGKKDATHLTSLPMASERLRLFSADLNEPESFKPAVEGCTAVFHLAHPMDFHLAETREAVTTRAVQGLRGILQACSDTDTVRRFVYTSSAVTLCYNSGNSCLDVIDEEMWTDVASLGQLRDGTGHGEDKGGDKVSDSYVVSKVAVEMAALEFGRNSEKIEVVSLVLPLVAGPFICPSLPSSVFLLLAMILGTKKDESKYLFGTYNMVHVDDVASALIFLKEYPQAIKGRYICSSAAITVDDMLEHLSINYPEFELPSKECLKDLRAERRVCLSSKKLLSTGFEFKCGVDEMFSGAIKCCREKGLL